MGKTAFVSVGWTFTESQQPVSLICHSNSLSTLDRNLSMLGDEDIWVIDCKEFVH